MDARTPAELAPACADENRALLYDRLGRYFDWIEPGSVGIGRCGRCGADGVRVVLKDGKAGAKGKCVAQHALTAKRDAPASGEPMAYGSKPLARKRASRGEFSIAMDRSYCLVRPNETLFVGSVLPSSPLPAWVDARLQFNGPSFADLLKICLGDVGHPYLLANFSKKADIGFRLTEDPCVIVVNGGNAPVTLEKARLLAILGLLREFGMPRVLEAMKLKESLSEGDANARDQWRSLKDKAPEIMARFDEVPGKDEPERSYAFDLFTAEAKATKATKAAAERNAADAAGKEG